MPLSADNIEQIGVILGPMIRESARDACSEALQQAAIDRAALEAKIAIALEEARKAHAHARRAMMNRKLQAVTSAVGGIIGGFLSSFTHGK